MAKKKKGLEALKQDLENDTFKNPYAENLRKKVDSGKIKSSNTETNTTVKKTTKKNSKTNNNSSNNSNNNSQIKTTVGTLSKNKVNADGYKDTGKKLGDYSKVDYNNRKDYKVYSKGNNFYFYNEKSKKYEMITKNTNNEMKSVDTLKKKKDNKTTSTANTSIANGTPFNNTDKTNQNKTNQPASGKLQEKETGATNKLNTTDKDTKAKQQLNIVNQLKLDTSNKTGEEYNQYAGKLKAKQDKENQKKSYNGTLYDNLRNNLKTVGKVAESTLTTTGYLLNKGATKGVEGILDAGATIGSNIADKVGNDTLSKQLKKWAKEDRTSKVTKPSLGQEMKLASAENNTVVKRDNIGGAVAENIGQMIPTLLAGGVVGKAGAYIFTGATAMGIGSEEALQSGANIDQATLYGIANGATEIATEWLTGGIPGLKGTAGGGLDKLVAKGLGQESLEQVSNSLAKAIIKSGYKAIGEGGEEALSEMINPLLKNITYSKDEKIDWNNVVESAIIGGIAGGILNAPSTVSDIKGSLNTNELTTNEQAVLDVVVNNRYNEEIKDKKDLSEDEQEVLKTKIENEAREDLENGNIDIDTIESALGGETYQNYKQVANQTDELQSQIDTLNNKNMSEMTLSEYKETNKKIEDLEKQISELKKQPYRYQLNQEMMDKVKDDNRLQKSYSEYGKRNQRFTREETKKDSELAKNVYKSASNVMNNSTKSHNLADMVAKTSTDTGIKYEFTNTQGLKDMGYNVSDERVINGLNTKDGKVLINIDSNKALNRVLGHETTHLFENTEDYQTLQNVVLEYAKTKGEYDSRKAELEKTYKGIEANIDNELTADLVGDYLFDDIKFVEHLSKNRNIFQKIYDKIKYLYKIATAGSKEKRQLEKAKRTFEKVYQNSKVQASNEVKYRVSSEKVNYTGNSSLTFSEQIDKWRNGEISKNSHLMVFRETPEIYQQIGLKNLPITLVANKLDRIYNSNGRKNGEYHGLGESVKKLPNALANPLNIVQSTTDENSIVVITELSDNNDNIVIASIKIDGNGQLEIDNINRNIRANVLTSAYGRKNYDYQLKPHNNDFTGWMEENAKNNRIIYDIDDGILKKRINGQWLQLPNSNNSLSENNVPQSNTNVKSDTTKYSISKSEKNTNELENSSFSLKQKQNEIIQKTNPVEDDYHTWIRSSGDIRTFEETLQDNDYREYYEAGEDFDASYSAEMAKKALETGKITVYSSYPIEQGVFVSPSKLEASQYAGGDESRLYSKEIDLTDVAWIDPTQGQYAKVYDKYSLSQNTTKDSNETKFGVQDKDIIEGIVNEAIDFLGEDGRYDLSSRSDENLYAEIYDDSEKQLNRELTDDDYELIDEILDEHWEDEAYVSKTGNESIKKMIDYINEQTNFVKNHEYIKLNKANIEDNFNFSNSKEKIENSIPELKKIDTFINRLSEVANVENVSTSSKSISTYIDIPSRDLQKTSVKNFLTKNGVSQEEINNIIDETKEAEQETVEIRISNHNSGGKFDLMSGDNATYNSGDIFINVNDLTADTKYSLSNTKLPKAPIKKSEITSTDVRLKKALLSYQKEVKGLKQEVKELKKALPKSKVSVNGMNTKNTLPLAMKNEVKKVNLNKAIKEDAKNVSKVINQMMSTEKVTSATELPDLKLRKWIETSTESDVVDHKLIIEDMNTLKATYEVKSNKKSLEKANRKINLNGYEKALDNFNSQLLDDKLPSAEDVIMGERLLQLAIQQNDMTTAKDLIENISIMGTELGQATQALSVIKRLTPEGQLGMLTKVVQRAKAKSNKAFEDVKITPEMVEKVLKTYKEDGTWNQTELDEAVEHVKQDIADQLKITAKDKIDEWRYLAMLGNPKTHIRNIVSNVAMKGTISVKNAMARTMETILPVKNRTKTWRKTTDIVKQYAKETTIAMKDDITGQNKYNERVDIESKKRVYKIKLVEKARNFNSKALEGEDWFFSKSAFKNSFEEYLTANGIKTQADIDSNPELISKAKAYALNQAEISTFRQYSWMASKISQIENKNLATKLFVGAVIPFKKTPINIAKTGLSYSPLGLVKSISYDAYMVKTGQMEASQMVDNIAQSLTGSSLLLLGYALAKAGLLQGAGEDDKEGKYNNALGDQGYSLKIGNNTYSISWLSPLAMPLLEGATFFDVLEEQEDWDMNVITNTLAKTLDPLSEMSFLSGLDDALSSYDSGMMKFASIFENAGQSYVSQFFPTLFSQLANTLDDKKRSTTASKNSKWKFGEETVRQIMYKIPGLRNKLEVSTDIWGNEREQSDNIIERAFESFLAPYSKKENIGTSLDEELKEVYRATDDSSVIPSTPYSYLNYQGEKYQMSASEYTQYKKKYGQTANDYLTSLVKNSNYQSATSEEKAKMISKMYEYAKAQANEEYFADKSVEYSSNNLTTINTLKDLNMSSANISEYVSVTTKATTIRNGTEEDKKVKIANIISNANLNDKQMAYTYSKYYSSEDKLNTIYNTNIPMSEFIKFDSQEFTSSYDSDGKIVKNSKRNAVIKYVNSLSLSVPQKAMLIKSEYSSYDKYDSQIMNYINSQDMDFLTKAKTVKTFGFTKYDKSIINYVKNNYSTVDEQQTLLKDLGFTIYTRNGKVYVK